MTSGGSTPAVVVLVPVLARPHRVEPLLRSVRAATPEPHRVLFIADEGDDSEIRALTDAGAEHITGPPGVNYAQKINAGFMATTEPFVLMAADDLDFHPDWYPRALAYMTEGIGVVGTNDIANPRVMCGTHSTHSLIRRSYIDLLGGVIDEPLGTVLHEGYPHEYCDDEFIQTAQSRDAYAHAFDSIIEHLHPIVDKAPDDPTYQIGRAHTPQGRRLFKERRALWTR